MKGDFGGEECEGGKCILCKRIPTTLRLSCYEEMQDTRKSECGKRVYQEVPSYLKHPSPLARKMSEKPS